MDPANIPRILLLLATLLSLAYPQPITHLSTQLSIPRASPALAYLGDYVYIAGGSTPGPLGGSTNIVEVWSISQSSFVGVLRLTANRIQLIGLSYSNTVLFIDQNTGDIEQLDPATNTFSVVANFGAPVLAAASVNNKALLVTGTYGTQATVYNLNTRFGLPELLCTTGCSTVPSVAIITVGNRVYFGGLGPQLSRLFYYDDTTQSFTLKQLSVGRPLGNVVLASGYLFFSGRPFNPFNGELGNATLQSIVDIYSIADDSLTSTSLPTPRSDFAFAAANNEVYFAGGLSDGTTPGGWTNLVEIYNAAGQFWENPTTLSSDRAKSNTASVLPGYAAFVGGSDTINDFSASSHIDIFNPYFARTSFQGGFHISAGTLVVGTTAFFAGGEVQNGKSSAFDVLEFLPSLPCSQRYQCNAVSQQYNYVDCISNVCTCLPTFAGTATANDVCTCTKAGVYYNTAGQALCLWEGQCASDYNGPNCHGLCTNYNSFGVGVCAQ